MDWAIFATIGAAVYGLNSVMAKLIVGQKVRDVRTFYFLTAILSPPIALGCFMVEPITPGAPTLAIGLAIAAGVAHSAALMLMWLTLSTEEVSRAVPVVMTFPVFVAILAALFLEETLSIVDWAAILVTVAGAILISSRRAPSGRVLISRSFLFLVMSSLAFAITQVLSKEALEDISQWNMLAIDILFLTPGMLLFSIRRSVLQESYEVIKKPLLFSWVVGYYMVAFVATLCMFAAFAAGPVSLSSALLSTRTLFLFVYSVIISWLAPTVLQEPLSPRILMTKAIAIAMIVAGGVGIIL